MDVFLLWCETTLGPELMGVFADPELAGRRARTLVGKHPLGHFSPIRYDQLRVEPVDVEVD